MPSRTRRRIKSSVLSAVPPHVWVVTGRARHKRPPPYTRPGLSRLRHCFTAEDLRDAVQGVGPSQPRYSNPYNSENCHYHYLFPPGMFRSLPSLTRSLLLCWLILTDSPYASWNPRLGNHFWDQAREDVAQDKGARYHYLFPPGAFLLSSQHPRATYGTNLREPIRELEPQGQSSHLEHLPKAYAEGS